MQDYKTNKIDCHFINKLLYDEYKYLDFIPIWLIRNFHQEFDSYHVYDKNFTIRDETYYNNFYISKKINLDDGPDDI